ncbi:DASS family sodium-coupled anion symporter [Actinobacillus delphinicola]|uniref:Anion transporter n=1 Tax=Actinobacillus delphinicola TaxID=51161 RepID=A0A448TSS0_9PAST|nr:DASS family sodium-coupled anion symporter [Actinobacillus delphinicola]VEJ09084.1 anion transporter [Actinobacillus delphinicola]
MNFKKIIQYAIILIFPVLTFIIPAPAGLPVIGWYLIGIYIAAILGIIFKPFPTPVVLLTAVAVSAIVIGNTAEQIMPDGTKVLLKQTDVLSGYKSGTTWLVFAAFMLSTAFVITGLGRRIAYKMIGAFGSTSLRLGYVNAFLDFIISPAMPSVTARGAGIMLPIMNSISLSLGSEPTSKESAKKIGSYLMVNTYMVVKTTGYITFTAMATNAIALKLLQPILNLQLSWMQWFLATCVPGLVCLFLVPLITYFLNKPTLKAIDNKKIASDGLEEMGPMSYAEKALLVIFILAVLAWMLSSYLHLKSSIIAVAIMPLLVLCKIVTWDDLLAKKSAWNTFIWYGGLLGLASVLDKANFFHWLASVMESMIHSDANHATLITIVILFLSVVVRYLYASGGAYVASMLPVFAAVGVAAGANPFTLGMGLLCTSCFGGALTHYGSGPAAPIFGTGYNSIKSWWLTGGIMALVSLIVLATIGFGWWNFILHMGWIQA